MSGGGIGKGLEYWAAFKITGDMEPAKLQAAIREIQKIIEKNGGKIETEARVAKGTPSFSFAFKGFTPPPGP